MVDRNNGQLDMANRMIFPMPDLDAVFTSFNWDVHNVDATQYDGVYAALEQFRFGPRNGKPTAIVCHGTKGHGALSDFLNKHKVTVPDRLLEQEMALQTANSGSARVDEFARFHRGLRRLSGWRPPSGHAARPCCGDASGVESQRVRAGVAVADDRPGRSHRGCRPATSASGTMPPAARLDKSKEYAASDVVTLAMKVFARDRRVV